jgi:hypothetical protein
MPLLSKLRQRQFALSIYPAQVYNSILQTKNDVLSGSFESWRKVCAMHDFLIVGTLILLGPCVRLASPRFMIICPLTPSARFSRIILYRC